MSLIVDRGLGQPIPAGHFDAVFYQATHDSGGWDVGFHTAWAKLKAQGAVRGAYHFARPGASSGAAQATFFVDRVLSQGWDSKRDLWMLDVEVPGLSGQALKQWVIDFMEYAKAKLGDRGFLYIGWPFYVVHVDAQDFHLLFAYRWWLPNYGPNDGQQHDYHEGEPVDPVLHQYTSKPYDKSVIINATAWHDLFDPEVIVHQQFNPPLKVVSTTLFIHPDPTKGEHGVCSVSVQSDGSCFTEPANAYMGGMNGSKDFHGRTAARVVAAHKLPGHGKYGYVIVDGKNEMYGPKFPNVPAGVWK